VPHLPSARLTLMCTPCPSLRLSDMQEQTAEYVRQSLASGSIKLGPGSMGRSLSDSLSARSYDGGGGGSRSGHSSLIPG